MIGFKTSYCKNKKKIGEKLNFFTHVLASSPQDRSSLCRTSSYGLRIGDFQAYAVSHIIPLKYGLVLHDAVLTSISTSIRRNARKNSTNTSSSPGAHCPHLISRSLNLAIFAIWEKLRNLILAK